MSAISDFSTSRPSNSGDAFNSLSSTEFLRIIFTELQNQDPLEPQDTGAMLDQLSTLRNIESDTNMVNSLTTLVSQNEFAGASQLIGSLVSGITIDNRRVADLVISVSQTEEGPILNLFSGDRMFFDQVDEIAGPLDDDGNGDGDGDDDDDNTNPPDDNTNDSRPLPPPVVGDLTGIIPNRDTRDNASPDPIANTVSPTLAF